MRPDFLVAGHIVKDQLEGDSWRPGGSVLYAAIQAQKLGLRTAALTSCAEDISPASQYPEIDWRVLASAQTTTFLNRYESGVRNQELLALARPLDAAMLPLAWYESPITLLAPVCGEVELDITLHLDSELVGIGAQGWLRQVEDRVIKPGPGPDDPAWGGANAVFTSLEDLVSSSALEDWREAVDVLVLTRAEHGATIWDNLGQHEILAYPIQIVDPTGAGDVFAAAFLVRYHECADSLEAGRFAAAAASLAINAEGTAGIGDRLAIEGVMRRGKP